MRRLGWWLVIFAVVGCSNKAEQAAPSAPDAGPAQVAEHEPNDRPEQAQPISASTIVTASLNAIRPIQTKIGTR